MGMVMGLNFIVHAVPKDVRRFAGGLCNPNLGVDIGITDFSQNARYSSGIGRTKTKSPPIA